MENNNGWIKVSDRLPEPRVRVLVCLTYGGGRKEIKISYYNDRVECFEEWHSDIITHWQPLPEPPKE